MSVINRISAVPLVTFNAGALLVTYQPLNPNGLGNACSILRIINNSNAEVTISYDGITDHDFIPDGDILVINPQVVNQPSSNVSLFPKGQVIYAKAAGAGMGTIVVAGYTQLQG